MLIIFSFLFIWALCWTLHIFSNYLDFEKPAKQEAEYKKQIIKKYGIASIRREIMTGTVKKDMKSLYDKANEYACSMIAMQNAQCGLSPDMQNKLYEYYKKQYIDKYRLSFS